MARSIFANPGTDHPCLFLISSTVSHSLLQSNDILKFITHPYQQRPSFALVEFEHFRWWLRTIFRWTQPHEHFDIFTCKHVGIIRSNIAVGPRPPPGCVGAFVTHDGTHRLRDLKTRGLKSKVLSFGIFNIIPLRVHIPNTSPTVI